MRGRENSDAEWRGEGGGGFLRLAFFSFSLRKSAWSVWDGIGRE